MNCGGRGRSLSSSRSSAHVRHTVGKERRVRSHDARADGAHEPARGRHAGEGKARIGRRPCSCRIGGFTV